ncbi:MAG: phosphonate ABC transporter ATP-binding protein [Geminicoccaceae bacterium]
MAYLAEGEIGRDRRGRSMTRAIIEPAARLDDVVMRYPGLDRPAIAIDRLTINKGERVAVIGPSGGGKTTLLRLLNGTLQPSGGSIEILGEHLENEGRQPRELRRRTGMIFQDFALIERATVMQNVLAGRLGFAHPWLSLFGKFGDEDRRIALEAIAEVELLDKAGQRVDGLSGGQRQRVAIARVLAQGPEMILADEPVSNLDPALTRTMIDLLTRACQRRGAALVMAIHQPDIAKTSMDRVIAVNDGQIVFDVPSEALTEAALAQIYGRSDQGAPDPRMNAQDSERTADHRYPA